jgi:UPF0716 protein FxsA
VLLRLFLLFTLVPIAELAILIRLGGLFGFWPTLALVLGTGAAGAWLARREGLRSWLAVQGELATGRIPTTELVHSLVILVAGIVLITPGILTDIAGIALLFRPVRSRLIRSLRSRFERQIEQGSIHVVGGFGSPFGPGMGFGAPPEPTDEPPRGREIVVEEREPIES